MEKYQLILFDLDGTLTDPKKGITKSVQYALARFGIYEEDLDNLKKFIGPPLKNSFMEYYSFDEKKAWQAVLYYREYFSHKGIFENTVFDGIPELLRELNSQGRRVVLATSKPTVFAEQILEHFQLRPYFYGIVGSNLDGSRVVKSEVIQEALRIGCAGLKNNRLTINPANWNPVMIGDREHDIDGARDNGIDAIAVSYGYGSLAELEGAEPTHIVDSVAGLRNLLL